jgi:hypothetical protein
MTNITFQMSVDSECQDGILIGITSNLNLLSKRMKICPENKDKMEARVYVSF